MKVRFSPLLLIGLIVALVTVLLPAGVALGQSTDEVPSTAMAGMFLVFVLIIAGACYVYVALALQTIANKTHTDNAWLAWIPIANILLMLNIAKKPVWWIILFLVPIVNIIIIIIVWMGIAEARGKPNWWGILMIVPIVSLIVPGYLAWAD